MIGAHGTLRVEASGERRARLVSTRRKLSASIKATQFSSESQDFPPALFEEPIEMIALRPHAHAEVPDKFGDDRHGHDVPQCEAGGMSFAQSQGGNGIPPRAKSINRDGKQFAKLAFGIAR